MTLVSNTDLFQKGFGCLDRFGLGLAQHAARRLDDVVEDAHVRPEVEALEHKTDAGT